MLRLARFVGIVGACLALSACPRRYAAWVVPGSARGNLTIGVGSDRGSSRGIEVGLIAFADCADHDSAIRRSGIYLPLRLKRLPWSATATAQPTTVQRVVYGRLPAGFRQLSATVEPLTAGCYVAEVDGGTAGGSAYARFVIDSAGRVREVSSTGRPNER